MSQKTESVQQMSSVAKAQRMDQTKSVGITGNMSEFQNNSTVGAFPKMGAAEGVYSINQIV